MRARGDEIIPVPWPDTETNEVAIPNWCTVEVQGDTLYVRLGQYKDGAWVRVEAPLFLSRSQAEALSQVIGFALNYRRISTTAELPE